MVGCGWGAWFTEPLWRIVRGWSVSLGCSASEKALNPVRHEVRTSATAGKGLRINYQTTSLVRVSGGTVSLWKSRGLVRLRLKRLLVLEVARFFFLEKRLWLSLNIRIYGQVTYFAAGCHKSGRDGISFLHFGKCPMILRSNRATGSHTTSSRFACSLVVWHDEGVSLPGSIGKLQGTPKPRIVYFIIE